LAVLKKLNAIELLLLLAAAACHRAGPSALASRNSAAPQVIIVTADAASASAPDVLLPNAEDFTWTVASLSPSDRVVTVGCFTTDFTDPNGTRKAYVRPLSCTTYSVNVRNGVSDAIDCSLVCADKAVYQYSVLIGNTVVRDPEIRVKGGSGPLDPTRSKCQPLPTPANCPPLTPPR
jgi:hypothetical protein